MKKLLSISMIIFALVLVGCSNQAEGDGNSDQANEDYPSNSIELIVPYDAGGTTDVMARILAESASEYLPNNQSIVVVNRAGGNGAIGTTSILQAEADGYTIGMVDEATLNIRPHVDNDVLFTHDSFQTIMQVANVPQLLITTSDSEYNTFDDILAEDSIQIGTSGFGGIQHLVLEQLNSVTDVDIENVQFDGSSGVVNGVLSKEVPIGVAGVPNVTANEDLQPVANAASERTDAFPDLPTLQEEGYEVIGDLHFGIIAPDGLSEDITETLHQAFKSALEEEEVVDQLVDLGYDITYGDPEEYQNTITETFNHYEEVLREAGLIED